jgi:hypothetical protein
MVPSNAHADKFEHSTSEVRTIFNNGVFKTDWLVGTSPHFVTTIGANSSLRLIIWDVNCKNRTYRLLLSKRFVSINFVYDSKEFLPNSPWISMTTTPGGRANAVARCG